MQYITASHLVQNGIRHWGRFLKTPVANPLDEFTGLQRMFKSLRTKQWAGFTLVHNDLYAAMILQDARYIKSSEIYIRDRSTGTLHQHSGIGGGSGFVLGSTLLNSAPQFSNKGYHIVFDFGTDAVTIKVDIAATKSAAAFKGELLLSVKGCSHPLVVSARLPQGGSMYTNKIIYAASGYMQCGDKRYDFDPQKDVAILDEHKSHLPYHTTWTWGTFALPADGNFVGANFATRPQYGSEEEESGLWTPDAVEPLSSITFTPAGTRELDKWHIYSADKRLDVVFKPEGYKPVKLNAVVVGIDYEQMFGTYSGTIRGKNKTWSFEGVHGVCERMDMRA